MEVPLRNSTVDALLPLATHQRTPLTAVLFPIHQSALVLEIWGVSPLPLDGMGTEWDTKNIIISIYTLIIKCGHRHHLRLDINLLILCNNPIRLQYSHIHIHYHHHRRLDTSILILYLLLIPHTHTHTHHKSQFVRHLLSLTRAL
ncbi:hypothetical protein PENPOL_c002G01742 [Penicillium polonicum]|uniref:Uncharacterized protein n=1 Tax=Penicillium polonicum TaxID=60169 RepID=A0A1V6NWY5_PENPO|nr:hypothetical protein PENPOL_c002G01742 [Penicillium polonicum]